MYLLLLLGYFSFSVLFIPFFPCLDLSEAPGHSGINWTNETVDEQTASLSPETHHDCGHWPRGAFSLPLKPSSKLISAPGYL